MSPHPTPAVRRTLELPGWFTLKREKICGVDHAALRATAQGRLVLCSAATQPSQMSVLARKIENFLVQSYSCMNHMFVDMFKLKPYHIIQSYQVWIVLDSLDHCENWYWVDTHEENSFLYISDSDPNLDTKMWQQVSRADQAPCNKPLQPWQPAKHHHLQEGEQWPVLLLQVLWQFWCRGVGGPESPGNQFLLPMPWDIGWKVFNLWSNLKNMFLYLKLLKFRT